MHENAEGVINAITSVISGEGINIANLLDKSKKDKAYMILDPRFQAVGYGSQGDRRAQGPSSASACSRK